jgi:hypothetical protein
MEVDTNEETYVMNSVITEAMVEEAWRNREKAWERNYGQKAIDIAIQAGIFQQKDNRQSTLSKRMKTAWHANNDEWETLACWDKELKKKWYVIKLKHKA